MPTIALVPVGTFLLQQALAHPRLWGCCVAGCHLHLGHGALPGSGGPHLCALTSVSSFPRSCLSYFLSLSCM